GSCRAVNHQKDVAMPRCARARSRRSADRTARTISALLAVARATLVMPATSVAAVLHFGSPLRAHASLNTNDLSYTGINTQVGDSVVHTSHFGADTALWNAGDRAPAAGDVAKVSLEGCAQAAKSGPPPLTQIHFQTLAPQGGGAVE